MVDIPEQDYQKLQTRLNEASRMVTVVRDSNDAITIQDFEGKILAWNRGAERMFGYSEQEALKMPIWQLAPPDKAAEQKDFNRRIFAGEKVVSFETQRLTKDGRRLDVWLTVTKLTDEGGKIIGIAATERDITEHNKIEAEIRRAEARYRTLFDASIDILVLLDADGKIIDVNQQTGTLGGYKKEEIIGKNLTALTGKFTAQSLALIEANFAKRKEGKTVAPYEIEGIGSSGQRLTFEVEAIDETGQKLYFEVNRIVLDKSRVKEGAELVILHDITQRKKSEESNNARVIAEAANRAKSEFLANMSHELRTPLNSINGFSEVLYDETFGPLNEKQKRYIGNVLTSGKHLLLLINQVLDLAKVEAGKMKLELSNLPMKSLLNDMAMLVAEMAGKKKLAMSLEIAEDLPDIEGDELKVREIIYNLLSNAVKFTPEGGEIGLRAKKADNGIEVVIWDMGLGIAPENMGKIFEGFFRVDTPYSRVTEGTGLGLPLSKKLVELHGGTFSIKSAGLYKGTEVRFILPVIPKKAA